MPPPRALLAAIRFPAVGDDASDTDLLGRFADDRDAAAFDILVRRHARLVWGVCRRTLGPGPDAEDAFQATFLVLARRADRARHFGTAAGFLFGVARRVSLKAKGRAVRPVVPGSRAPSEDPAATAAFREIQAILDDEIGRLPDRYRLPFVLCVLEGKPRARAAAELGLNPGTLSARLARARLRLRDRLTGRGVSLTAALAATDLAADAAPPGLAAVAVAVATRAGPTGANVLILASEGWWAMKAKLLAAAVVVAGVGGVVGWAGGGPAEPSKTADAAKPAVEAKHAEPAKAVGPPNGKLTRTVTIRGKARRPVWSSDGTLIAVPYEAGDSSGIVAYDPGQVDPLAVLAEVGAGGQLQDPPGNILGFVGDQLVTDQETSGRVNVEPKLRFWNIREVPNLLQRPAPSREVGYPDGRMPLAVRADETAVVWASQQSRYAYVFKLADLSTSNPHVVECDFETKDPLGVTTDPAGRVLVGFARGNDADSIMVLDSADGKRLWSRSFPRESVNQGYKDHYPSPAFWVGPDGKSVYVTRPVPRQRNPIQGQVDSKPSQRVHSLDLKTGREVGRVELATSSRYQNGIHRLQSSPGGRLLAGTISDDSSGLGRPKMTVWDAATGKVLKRWSAGAEFAFAPDRETLALVEDVSAPNAPVGKSVLGLWDLSGLGR